MPKYRKKPVVVEAVQWTGENMREAFNFVASAGTLCASKVEGKLSVCTLKGELTARPGDYIIKGVNGEFYPCKPDIFEKTYERVGEDA